MFDVLSSALSPYKDALGAFAGVITVLQIFSGVFVILDIRKKQSTSGFSALPFLGGLALGILYTKFGYLIGDNTTKYVNIISMGISTIYVLMFYHYCPLEEMGDLVKVSGRIGAFTAVLIAYATYEDEKVVEFRFGLILTLLLFLLIGSPLFGLKEIIRKKSVEGLPFPMILSGTCVALSWLLYGIALNNAFVIVQNLIAALLSGIQLLLFAIYPSTSKTEKKTAKRTKFGKNIHID